MSIRALVFGDRWLTQPLVVAACLAVCSLAAHVRAAQVTYDMVTVGDPGNASDPNTGGVYGAVNYSYQIGKYDVTIGQYAAFLNAVDPGGTNPNDIYYPGMGLDLNIAGISYSAEAPTGAKYSVMNNGGDSANRPITYVSWFDAARFANWMTNGQGSGSTETGAYTLYGPTGFYGEIDPAAAFRLPTEDEWYKAAYYSPNYGGAGAPGYYAYATQSDTVPGTSVGSDPNQANYGHNTCSGQNQLTDVGAFSGSMSFYGTFDQTGNVSQWIDRDGFGVGVRGGEWDLDSSYLSSSFVGSVNPSTPWMGIGFRLAGPAGSPAAVPEIDPAGMGSVLALVTGALGLLERRRLKAKLAA